MPMERRLTSAEIRRKTNKPIMEKKRRERINKCLEELKSIVLRAVNEESRPNKLEKADILEMTVKYLRTIRQPVHLKSDKDNILGDRTRSTIHAMAKQDYSRTGSGLRSGRHFDSDSLRYAPYLHPHCRRIDVPANQQIVPLLNHSQGFMMTEKYWSCFHFDVAQRRRYPPIPTSPISSVSSKSPAPLSLVEDSDNYSELKQYDPERTLRHERGDSDPNQFFHHDRNNSTSSSNDSNAVYRSESLNNKSSKEIGILWRPWGTAS